MVRTVARHNVDRARQPAPVSEKPRAEQPQEAKETKEPEQRDVYTPTSPPVASSWVEGVSGSEVDGQPPPGMPGRNLVRPSDDPGLPRLGASGATPVVDQPHAARRAPTNLHPGGTYGGVLNANAPLQGQFEVSHVPPKSAYAGTPYQNAFDGGSGHYRNAPAHLMDKADHRSLSAGRGAAPEVAHQQTLRSKLMDGRFGDAFVQDMQSTRGAARRNHPDGGTKYNKGFVQAAHSAYTRLNDPGAADGPGLSSGEYGRMVNAVFEAPDAPDGFDQATFDWAQRNGYLNPVNEATSQRGIMGGVPSSATDVIVPQRDPGTTSQLNLPEGMEAMTEAPGVHGMLDNLGARAQDPAGFQRFTSDVFSRDNGQAPDPERVEALRGQVLFSEQTSDWSWMPPVERVGTQSDDPSASTFLPDGADAAYVPGQGANDRGRILLNRGLGPQEQADLYTEELGHAIDQRLNGPTGDAQGDEGELFRRALSGQIDFSDPRHAKDIADIRSDDDHAVAQVDGVQRSVELADAGGGFGIGGFGVGNVNAANEALDEHANAAAANNEEISDAIGNDNAQASSSQASSEISQGSDFGALGNEEVSTVLPTQLNPTTAHLQGGISYTGGGQYGVSHGAHGASPSIWVQEGGTVPMGTVSNGQYVNGPGSTYYGFVPAQAHLEDCVHCAEEIMNRERLPHGEDVNSVVVAPQEYDFGEPIDDPQEFAQYWQPIVNYATNPANANSVDQHANPQVGQAFAIFPHSPPAGGEFPFHAAAVVATDGDQYITMEHFGGAEDAEVSSPPGFHIYGQGAASFHSEYAGAWNQDTSTVVIKPKEE